MLAHASLFLLQEYAGAVPRGAWPVFVAHIETLLREVTRPEVMSQLDAGQAANVLRGIGNFTVHRNARVLVPPSLLFSGQACGGSFGEV